MAAITGFSDVDTRYAIASRYVDAMLRRKDLTGLWLYDFTQRCNIAVFTSPSITDFFQEVGYSPEAAAIMADDLEAVYVDEPGLTRFGKALHTYADGLGSVGLRKDANPEATVFLSDKRPIVHPNSPEAQLQECGLRWVRKAQQTDLYVLDGGVQPRSYSEVAKSPRLRLNTRTYGLPEIRQNVA